MKALTFGIIVLQYKVLLIQCAILHKTCTRHSCNMYLCVYLYASVSVHLSDATKISLCLLIKKDPLILDYWPLSGIFISLNHFDKIKNRWKMHWWKIYGICEVQYHWITGTLFGQKHKMYIYIYIYKNVYLCDLFKLNDYGKQPCTVNNLCLGFNFRMIYNCGFSGPHQFVITHWNSSCHWTPHLNQLRKQHSSC